MTWRRTRFGDVVRQIKDRVDPVAEGLERYIAGEHMESDELKIAKWGLVGEGYLGPAFHARFRPGQVLYGSRRTYLRKVALADFEGVCANTTFVLEVRDPAILLPELLPLLMSTERFHAHSIAESKGSVNPYVNWPDLAKFEFDLPPIEEQRRIAGLLWSIERTCEAARLSRSCMDAVANATTDQLMSPSSGAPLQPCRAVCKEITVGVVVRPTQYYADEGVAALRSLNIAPNRILLSDLVYFDPASHSRLGKSTLRVGDVVIVRTGRPGDAAVVDERTAGSNCIDLIIARPTEALYPEYLARYLNSSVGRASIFRGTAGTAQQHFNVGAFAALPIPMPAYSSQVAIVDTLQAIDHASRRVDDEIDATVSMKVRILGEVFSS